MYIGFGTVHGFRHALEGVGCIPMNKRGGNHTQNKIVTGLKGARNPFFPLILQEVALGEKYIKF